MKKKTKVSGVYRTGTPARIKKIEIIKLIKEQRDHHQACRNEWLDISTKRIKDNDCRNLADSVRSAEVHAFALDSYNNLLEDIKG